MFRHDCLRSLLARCHIIRWRAIQRVVGLGASKEIDLCFARQLFSNQTGTPCHVPLNAFNTNINHNHPSFTRHSMLQSFIDSKSLPFTSTDCKIRVSQISMICYPYAHSSISLDNFSLASTSKESPSVSTCVLIKLKEKKKYPSHKGLAVAIPYKSNYRTPFTEPNLVLSSFASLMS